MPRIPILATIAVIGLPAVCFIADMLVTDPDRVSSMLALFQQHCLPRTAGKAPFEPRLTRLVLKSNQQLYANPNSRLTLELFPDRCAISDQRDPFPAPLDRQRLRDVAAQMVRTDLPMRTPDPTANQDMGWDELPVWMQGAPRSAQRWGVTLARLARQGRALGTILSQSLPADRPGG